MRVDPTVALVLMFLSLIAGAAAVSASWGYALGRTALQGVTQPDVRPSSLGTTRTQSSERKQLIIIPEQDIINEVKTRMGQGGEPVSTQPTPEEGVVPAVSSDSSQLSLETVAADSTEQLSRSTRNTSDVTFIDYRPGFPRIVEDRGVILEVRSAQPQGDRLLLELSLQNVGTKSVQLSSQPFDITNNAGQRLSADVEGLPRELPPSGEEYRGAVVIPLSSLYDAESISLMLTDDSRQRLELGVSDIPVAR